LATIARCAICQGAVGVTNGRRNRRTAKFYTCVQHHTRGPAVCPVTVYQPMEEVDQGLVAYLDRHVVTPELIGYMASEIRAAIEAQLPSRAIDVSKLEAELRAG
jgi:hypothetical protein